MEFLADPQMWTTLGILLLIQIILGMDNIVFISILADKLPEDERKKSIKWGIGLAVLLRILFVMSVAWIIGLKDDLFTVFGHGFSGKELILLAGGLFLLAKATKEIFENLEGEDHHEPKSKKSDFVGVVLQMTILNAVFSIDSVITAVGITTNHWIIIIGIVISSIVMVIAAEAISKFIRRHPSVKMLGLAFLILIGFVLVVDGFGHHINQNYVYFAMGFAIFVQVLNILAKGRKQKESVELRRGAVQEGKILNKDA